MKYKALLAGSSTKIINEFFMQMDSSFECQTSSLIYDDLKGHMKHFEPDIFVYCMRAELRDDIVTVASFCGLLEKNSIPFAVIADAPSLDIMAKIPSCNPGLTLRLPISTPEIETKLISFIRKSRTYPADIKPESEAPDTSFSDTSDILSKIEAELALLEKGIDITENSANSQHSLREPENPNKRRILVVDDATIVHKAIKGYLEDEFEVAAAISGKVALRFLKNKEVSLILLDYEMPNMDGTEVLKAIREDPDLKDIPVIFLTGINDVSKIQKALVLRPQGYLLKPVEKDDLLKKIHEAID